MRFAFIALACAFALGCSSSSVVPGSDAFAPDAVDVADAGAFDATSSGSEVDATLEAAPVAFARDAGSKKPHRFGMDYPSVGGDLSGSTNAATVVGIQGKAVPASCVGVLQSDGGASFSCEGVTLTLAELPTGTAGQALYTNDAGTSAVWVSGSGDRWCSTTKPGTCYVVSLSGADAGGGAIPLATGAYLSTPPVIASPKIIATSDGGQVLGFDGTYVYVDNPGGALGIGTSGSTAVYLGSSTPTTVQGTLYTDNIQPSSDGAWTSGTSNARWSQTFTEAVTNGNVNALPIETDWQFAPSTNQGDAGTNGNVWHKAYGYNTSAATAQTVASGTPASAPWFCPAIGTVSLVDVDFALKQNAAPANNSSGRVTNTCWTVADAGAWTQCGTTTEVGTENVNGSPCTSTPYAVTIIAGSGGCFIIDATCAGIAGNSDALFVVTVVNN